MKQTRIHKQRKYSDKGLPVERLWKGDWTQSDQDEMDKLLAEADETLKRIEEALSEQ